MTTSRLTGLFLCSTAVGGVAPLYAPDGSGHGGKAAQMRGFAVLEPRTLFDAAGVATFDTGEVDATAHDAPESVDQSHHDLMLALDAPALPLVQPSLNIVFIDSAVKDIDVLVADIGPDAEIYIIAASTDGVEQIASVLQGRVGIESLSIISHGRSGTLDLGSTKLTEASIAGRHADEMAIIRAALSGDADILLYGCEFAAGSRGRDAVQALASATGADVAASEDLTGAADLGGDWAHVLAPIINTLPANYATTEDTSIALTGLSIADAAIGVSTVNVTLLIPAAAGSLTGSSAGGVVVTGSGSNQIVLTGTLASINSYLSTSAPVFKPGLNFSGTIPLTMTSSKIGAATALALPSIEVTPSEGVAAAGWTIGNETPDIISGNGPWPGGFGYVVSNVSGASPQGGNMGLFINNDNGVVGSLSRGQETHAWDRYHVPSANAATCCDLDQGHAPPAQSKHHVPSPSSPPQP